MRQFFVEIPFWGNPSFKMFNKVIRVCFVCWVNSKVMPTIFNFVHRPITKLRPRAFKQETENYLLYSRAPEVPLPGSFVVGCVFFLQPASPIYSRIRKSKPTRNQWFWENSKGEGFFERTLIPKEREKYRNDPLCFKCVFGEKIAL